jgi:hypothetical protein
MKTVAGKAGSLSEGDLYRLSTNDYANLIELLDQDETVPHENVSVFKRRVTLVTSIDNGKTVSEQETPNNMDEKVPSDIARLHHIPKKRVPLPKMYLEFDQNKISELESHPIQLVEFLLEKKLLTKPESCLHCGHGKDFIHLIHSTHYLETLFVSSVLCVLVLLFCAIQFIFLWTPSYSSAVTSYVSSLFFLVTVLTH